MKTIQFPLDFSVSENQFLGSLNFIYERKDGSIISVIPSENYPDLYEVWDEAYLNQPYIMSFSELNRFINLDVSKLLTVKFFEDEQLYLN